MYAVIENNRLSICVAGYYAMHWYDVDDFCILGHEEAHPCDYGSLEIDVHKNGKKYLTGFTIDPRRFIVDYVKTHFGRDYPVPKRVLSVSVDTGKSAEMLTVDFFKARSFTIEGMENRVVFPLFSRRKGQLVIQSFDCLNVLEIIAYLAERFDCQTTTLIRVEDRAYNMKTKRWRAIPGGKKASKADQTKKQ